MTVTHLSEPHDAAAPNSSGIKVVVVGLGLAGLTTAVECHLKGHAVVAFDKVGQVRSLGQLAPYPLGLCAKIMQGAMG